MDILIGKQWRGDREFLAQATIGPPPLPPHLPAEFPKQDWGLAIGICFLVLNKLWQMVSTQAGDDSKLQNDLIKALIEQNKILLQAMIERKT